MIVASCSIPVYRQSWSNVKAKDISKIRSYLNLELVEKFLLLQSFALCVCVALILM